MLLFEKFKYQFRDLLLNLFSSLHISTIEINFDYNDDSFRAEFGDISTNICLLLSKKLKKQPLEIANIIKENFQSIEFIEKIVVAGPGFINIYFFDIIYKNYYKNIIDNKKLLYTKILNNNQKYNIEFVSANPTGPLHIGHGRGAVIGDVIARILLLKGYNISKEYYINDMGSQIDNLGKSLYYQYSLLCGNVIEFPENGYGGEYLIELASDLFKKNNNSLLEYSISWFSLYAKDILLKKIKKTLLNYQIDYSTWFSEKILHDSLAIEVAVKILFEKKYVYYGNEGTIWFKATLFGDEKDRVLKKSNGQWTYTAADIAYFLNKLERGYTNIIMILGQDHHSFKLRIEAIAKAFSFDINNLHIILYQLVTLKNEGEIIRMSKRKGNSIELQDVIDTVGSDVARFFYLQRKADAHLDFDLKEALEKSNKNPVFYIQYALVRIKSILEKSNNFISDKDYYKNIDNIELNNNEKMLLKKIALFDSLLNQICINFNSHTLAYYALDLASLFHSFYTSYSIIDQDKNITSYRVGLCLIVQEVLEKCTNLLGICVPERM